MKKLVCESLQEFNLMNEAKDGEKGPLAGPIHAVKTAPGRVLRKARAKMLMKKYKQKLTKRIEDVMPKYKPNIENLVAKTQNRINLIKGEDDEQKNIQMRDILEDLESNMKELLTTINDRMREQVKVYAESVHDRLEREGTITGVKFYPEEKANLLSQWKAVEEDVNALIQKKLIELIDDVNIIGFQEIKAKLQQGVKNLKGYYSSSANIKFSKLEKDNKSDPQNLIDQKEKDLYDYIIKDGKEFDIPYLLDKDSYKKVYGVIPIEEYIQFKIDNAKGKVGYAFYAKNRYGQFEISSKYPEIKYFIDETRVWSTGEKPFEKLQMVKMEKI